MSLVFGTSDSMLCLLRLLGRTGSYVQSDVLAAIADNCIEFLALIWRRDDLPNRTQLMHVSLHTLVRLPLLGAQRERALLDEILSVCERSDVRRDAPVVPRHRHSSCF